MGSCTRWDLSSHNSHATNATHAIADKTKEAMTAALSHRYLSPPSSRRRLAKRTRQGLEMRAEDQPFSGCSWKI